MENIVVKLRNSEISKIESNGVDIGSLNEIEYSKVIKNKKVIVFGV